MSPASITERVGTAVRFERLAGACALVGAAIFVFQEIVLRLWPGPSSVDGWLAAPLTPIEKVRMWLMFALFFLLLGAYTALTIRVGNDWARMGMVFVAVGYLVELAYRAVELHAVPGWADSYRQLHDETARHTLRARIEAFSDITTALYLVIRAGAIFANLCFATALWRGTGLTRALSLLFLGNAIRLSIGYLRPSLPAIAPVLDWIFILMVTPLYTSLGIWLWRSSVAPGRDARA
jgi:hypothetical protein